MIYRLAILNGDRRGQHVTVPSESMTIGRGSDCDLCLSDPEVASAHAVLEQNGHGLHIRDLGSMGKLLVNNHSVRQSNLKHGDTVELGHTRFLVQAVVEAEVRAVFDYPMNVARRRRGMLLALAAVLAFILVWRGVEDSQRAAARRQIPVEPVIVKIPVMPPKTAEPRAQVDVRDAAPSAGVAEADDAVVSIQAELAAPVDAGAIGLTAAEPPRAEPLPTTPVEQPDPYALAQAVVDDKVRGMMMEAHVLVTSKRLREADVLLSSVLHLAPNYAEAYVERAWLYEDRGMLEPAMAQWREVIRIGSDETRLAMARDRLARLLQARKVVEPKFGGRIRVLSADQMKFPESSGVREMRMVTVHLAPADPVHAPDAEAVRVDVIFFDRDRRTGAITQTRAKGENQDLRVSDPWQQGEMKTVTASYVVPAAQAPAGTRAEQFYGFVVRVYHFGALQDASAQPAGLLAQAGLAEAGAARAVAGAEATAFSRKIP